MPTLTLIRGAQGSGKTTLANSLRAVTPDCKHYEADMYWYDGDGHYQFEAEKLGRAHQWCQSVTEVAMRKGKNVIVSNTFTKQSELYPYRKLASEYGYAVQEIICRGEFENAHGVPEEVVQRKRNSIEL